MPNMSVVPLRIIFVASCIQLVCCIVVPNPAFTLDNCCYGTSANGRTGYQSIYSASQGTCTRNSAYSYPNNMTYGLPEYLSRESTSDFGDLVNLSVFPKSFGKKIKYGALDSEVFSRPDLPRRIISSTDFDNRPTDLYGLQSKIRLASPARTTYCGSEYSAVRDPNICSSFGSGGDRTFSLPSPTRKTCCGSANISPSIGTVSDRPCSSSDSFGIGRLSFSAAGSSLTQWPYCEENSFESFGSKKPYRCASGSTLTKGLYCDSSCSYAPDYESQDYCLRGSPRCASSSTLTGSCCLRVIGGRNGCASSPPCGRVLSSAVNGCERSCSLFDNSDCECSPSSSCGGVVCSAVKGCGGRSCPSGNAECSGYECDSSSVILPCSVAKLGGGYISGGCGCEPSNILLGESSGFCTDVGLCSDDSCRSCACGLNGFRAISRGSCLAGRGSRFASGLGCNYIRAACGSARPCVRNGLRCSSRVLDFDDCGCCNSGVVSI